MLIGQLSFFFLFLFGGMGASCKGRQVSKSSLRETTLEILEQVRQEKYLEQLRIRQRRWEANQVQVLAVKNSIQRDYRDATGQEAVAIQEEFLHTVEEFRALIQMQLESLQIAEISPLERLVENEEYAKLAHLKIHPERVREIASVQHFFNPNEQMDLTSMGESAGILVVSTLAASRILPLAVLFGPEVLLGYAAFESVMLTWTVTDALKDIVHAQANTALWTTVSDRARKNLSIDLRRPAVGMLKGRTVLSQDMSLWFTSGELRALLAKMTGLAEGQIPSVRWKSRSLLWDLENLEPGCYEELTAFLEKHYRSIFVLMDERQLLGASAPPLPLIRIDFSAHHKAGSSRVWRKEILNNELARLDQVHSRMNQVFEYHLAASGKR